MADEYWNRRIATTHYRFVRVSRATGDELGALAMLKGGTITRNNDVRIMETAEVDVVGAFNIGPDFVRIYMECSWADGHTESVCLGTFISVTPSRTVHSGYATSTVKLYGRLQELLSDKFERPVKYEKGRNAVQIVKELCESKGMEVIADPSNYCISNERVYGIGAQQSNSDTDDTKLGMINDLLDLAGFRAAKTDPYGRIVLRKYVNPMEAAPKWEFMEGASAKFESDMTDERDITDAANHVVVRYADETNVVVGEAWDNDPESEFSTGSRGYTITSSYEYTTMPEGKTYAEWQIYADKRAQSMLKTAQSVIRRVTAKHAYAPVTVNDTVTLGYTSGGVQGAFEIRTQKLSLKGGCPTETELRQFRR